MRRGRMLAVLLVAWFMAQFDFFVVNVAAPAFERELGASQAQLELIVGGYAFTFAAGMITGGRLGDRYGYRRMFVIGMTAFTLASVLCGLALDPAQLIAARLLQGLAGAIMVPQVLAMVPVIFEPRERPKAVGWYGLAGGVGAIAGQVLGGLLLTADVLGLGWRIVFLLNLPIGVVTVVLAARLLPKADSGGYSRLDLRGAAGLAIGLALVLVPLGLGHSLGWPVWAWVCMAAAVPVLALTGRWQRVLAARGGQPVLDLALLKVRSYVAGVGAVTAFTAYFVSFMFTLTLLLQGGFGLDAFHAGLAFAPMGLMFSITSLLGSRLVRRYGPRVVVAGGCVTAAGLIAMLFVEGVPWTIAALMVVGTGNGLVLPQLIGTALVEVEPGQAGIASGFLTTAQQFAGAGGVAVIGAVFFAAAAGPGGYPGGMRWSAAIDLVLILVVVAVVAYNSRRALTRAELPVPSRRT